MVPGLRKRCGQFGNQIARVLKPHRQADQPARDAKRVLLRLWQALVGGRRGMRRNGLGVAKVVRDLDNLKRVAELEQVDASAVTKRLAKLEKQLQTRLLKRVRQGVEATPEGAL